MWKIVDWETSRACSQVRSIMLISAARDASLISLILVKISLLRTLVFTKTAAAHASNMSWDGLIANVWDRSKELCSWNVCPR